MFRPILIIQLESALWERHWYESGPFNVTWFKPLMPQTEFTNVSKTLDNLVKEFEKLQGLDIMDVLKNLGEAMSKDGFVHAGSNM